MKLQLIILLLIICSACSKKTDETTLLYHELISYRDDLKMSVKSQEIYLSEATKNDVFYRNRFDSLNRINTELGQSFEQLKHSDRTGLLKLRDNFNEKYKLYLKFDSSNDYENITDSIFNRLIETDILKLRKKFQDTYMFMRGDKFE